MATKSMFGPGENVGAKVSTSKWTGRVGVTGKIIGKTSEWQPPSKDKPAVTKWAEAKRDPSPMVKSEHAAAASRDAAKLGTPKTHADRERLIDAHQTAYQAHIAARNAWTAKGNSAVADAHSREAGKHASAQTKLEIARDRDAGAGDIPRDDHGRFASK